MAQPFLRVRSSVYDRFPFLARPASLSCGPIVPGAKIPITWSFVAGSSVGEKTVVAKVYLDEVNVLLWTSQSTELKKIGTAYSTEVQAGVIEVLSGGVASDVYRFGPKTLRIDVQIDGSTEVYSNWAELDVVPERVSGIAWEFTDITGTNDPDWPEGAWAPLGTILRRFVIKHPFTIRGRVRNQATASTTFRTQILLDETDMEKGTVLSIEDRTLEVAPGVSQEIVFNALTKNWTWLISGVWVRNFGEPMRKTWRYGVRLRLTDDWNNVYEVSSSFEAQVDIVVTNEKNAYASAALAALGVSIWASIATLGAASAVAGSVAAGLGAKALDPPAPSSRYSQEVLTPTLPSTVEPQLGVLADLLHRLEELVELIEATNDVRDRMLGAAAARDTRAIKMQGKSYAQMLKRMAAIIEWAEAHGDEIVRLVDSTADFAVEPSRLAVHRARRRGLSALSRASLRRAGASASTRRLLETALRDDTVAELASDVLLSTSILLESISQIGLRVREEGARVLDAARKAPR